MDGIKLIKGLKAKDPHVRILVITGYSDIKTAVEVIKLGAFDYITKPLIPDEVLSILNNLLNRTEGKNCICGSASRNRNKSKKETKFRILLRANHLHLCFCMSRLI
jgi:two-component system response regulator HydG